MNCSTYLYHCARIWASIVISRTTPNKGILRWDAERKERPNKGILRWDAEKERVVGFQFKIGNWRKWRRWWEWDLREEETDLSRRWRPKSSGRCGGVWEHHLHPWSSGDTGGCSGGPSEEEEMKNESYPSDDRDWLGKDWMKGWWCAYLVADNGDTDNHLLLLLLLPLLSSLCVWPGDLQGKRGLNVIDFWRRREEKDSRDGWIPLPASASEKSCGSGTPRLSERLSTVPTGNLCWWVHSRD